MNSFEPSAAGASWVVGARRVEEPGVSAKAAEDNGFELPFVVQGPWDDPIMLPDAESLIRRSGAAAPLLDAVRDRKTRDAVRSAIERLSNGTLPSAIALPPVGPAAPATNAAGSAPATR